MCCGGFGGGGGGGGGNLLGTLTPTHLPYASAVHTLADTALTYDSVTGNLTTPAAIAVGANILLDGVAGQITTEFLHCLCSAAIDGLLSLGVAGLNINASKLTVDGATGDTAIAGTLDVKGQLTYEKSTVKRIFSPVPVGGGPWTVPVDVSLADLFFIGSGGGGSNTVIANPTNVTVTPGFVQTLLFRIESSAVAADSFSLDTAYHFSGGVDPLLAIDWSLPGYYYLGFIYNNNAVQWDYIGTLVGPIT